MLHCKDLELYTESSNCKQKAICESDFVNVETYCTPINLVCMSNMSSEYHEKITAPKSLSFLVLMLFQTCTYSVCVGRSLSSFQYELYGFFFNIVKLVFMTEDTWSRRWTTAWCPGTSSTSSRTTSASRTDRPPSQGSLGTVFLWFNQVQYLFRTWLIERNMKSKKNLSLFIYFAVYPLPKTNYIFFVELWFNFFSLDLIPFFTIIFKLLYNYL